MHQGAAPNVQRGRPRRPPPREKGKKNRTMKCRQRDAALGASSWRAAHDPLSAHSCLSRRPSLSHQQHPGAARRGRPPGGPAPQPRQAISGGRTDRRTRSGWWHATLMVPRGKHLCVSSCLFLSQEYVGFVCACCRGGRRVDALSLSPGAAARRARLPSGRSRALTAACQLMTGRARPLRRRPPHPPCWRHQQLALAAAASRRCRRRQQRWPAAWTGAPAWSGWRRRASAP